MKHPRLISIILASIASTTVFAQKRVLSIPDMPPNAPSLVSYDEVIVLYGNKFRFDLGPQTTQAPIGAAALPGGLGLSAAQIAKLPTSIAIPPAPAPVAHAAAAAPGAPAPVAAAIPDYPEACNQSDTTVPWPTASSDQTKRITVCWNGILDAINTDQNELVKLREGINNTTRNAAIEQRCYSQHIWNFRQPILSKIQADNLIKFAFANATAGNADGCYQPSADQWPLDKTNDHRSADDLGSDLVKLQQSLVDLTTALGYPTWANLPGIQNANSTLVKQVGDFITEVNSYNTGTATAGAGSVIAQTYTDFQNVVTNNKQWRTQLSNLIVNQSSTDLSALTVDIPIDPCRVWYGKGRTDTIKLHAVDLSSTSGASQDIQLATNTCNPRTIASTGVGVSFLPNPTYSFVPGDTTGTQVIGQTATNNQSPLYAVLYNVQLKYLKHGMELFASPGIGLTSSSSTANTDFLGGLSMSFARRVLFVTPSVDFGRRDQLAPGFKIGMPKGSLTSVPTQSHWPVGFMVSVSFGIGPS